MTNRMTITRKQKCEEKQRFERFKRLISNISLQKTWDVHKNGKPYESTKPSYKDNHIKAKIDKTQQNSKYRLCGHMQ